MMNTQELLQILACPRCMGSLEPLPSAEHPEGLACPACNVVYPVRDDIPIMLVDAAVERARWDEKQSNDVRLDNGTSDIDILDGFEYSFEYMIRHLLGG